LTEQPNRFAVSMADQLQALLYQKTGLVKAMTVVRQHPVSRQGDNRFTGFIRQSLAAIHDYLLAGMIATQVYALRLSVLFLSIPVFVLAGLVGAIDGIVQRDLNRWRGGRELGQRYHLAKSMVAPGLTLPWILYLAWPTTVHPWLIILPFAVFVGWVVAITAATFKKYF
jgi:integrating conjugative element membrane protein (TIGR03747 family)